MGDHARPCVNVGWTTLEETRFDPGDIVHVRSLGWLSGLVRRFSQSRREPGTWASHSAMVRYTIKPPWVIEALTKVVTRPLTDYAATGSHVVVSRKPGGLKLTDAKVVLDKADDCAGRTYGYLKILAHALDRLFDNAYLFRRFARMDDYPICSWLVAHCYDKIGIRFGVEPNAGQPDDILDWCMKEKWQLMWASSDEAVALLRRMYPAG